MKKSLKIIFAGTTNFSASYLYTLIHSSSHQILAIFTQKHSPVNYEKKIYANSVYDVANKNKLPIFQPKCLNTNQIIQTIQHLNPDIIIVVSYGLIIPQKILNLPPLGCINVHGSLLPRWRGAAPIQRAIEAGDTKTGISIIQMDTGIDTGHILYKDTCSILPHDTSLEIYKKLINIGTKALLYTLQQIISGKNRAIPQNNKLATYAKKIDKQEGKINWNTPSIQLERRIRAFNPWPVTYFHIHKKRIKIWEATINNINRQQKTTAGTILTIQQSGITIATNDGSLILKLVQIEGKKIISIKDLLNSKKNWFIPGTILS
ncbi:methionyl-tRNA formyltransferase [Blochmannia endosymbiont of Polyrhachis (Hedomyrma) turneri]|uniref:methionyl-tRNA formyltransferase n=1 Tax=Blochmannia endosymbiont of Polyrhachis (Hedomyrma) turneri TaxID=1505596 RepID=UPI00061A6835|nr:methionyl-tRNA formyltransferase [Blochmannia endosymbiont of Polyrhachis (Hedomyrma) turneri]AKC59795.1 Methionyl-tRNA formyltransferase [Blochmannia endosymbiont of Polyrhachis (Hedomyrma) turneri]